VLTGIAMVSNFPYRSFKDVDLKERLPFMYLVLGVGVMAFVAIRPEITLFILFVTYAFLGLIVGFYKKFFKKKLKS
jgi:CDP-diacylglycerol--serine O-phosphatidyltransferase